MAAVSVKIRIITLHPFFLLCFLLFPADAGSFRSCGGNLLHAVSKLSTHPASIALYSSFVNRLSLRESIRNKSPQKNIDRHPPHFNFNIQGYSQVGKAQDFDSCISLVRIQPLQPNKNLVVNTITGFLLFIFSYRKVLIIQGFYTPFVKKCCFERSNSTVGQHFLR